VQISYYYFMLYLIAYGIGIFIVLLLSIAMCFYSVSSLIASLMGAPYVPTKQKEIDFILNYFKMKKEQYLIELGSGDGRFVRSAAQKYGVTALGVDVQYWLLWYAQIVAKVKHIKNVTFKNQNFFKTDLSKADVIFVFLMPNTLKKLRAKFLKECKKGTVLISHGFTIEEWEKYLYYKIDHKPFPTYFYKIP
jgi:hypothetical protein